MMNITNVGTPNISENRKDRLHLKGEKSNKINIYPGADESHVNLKDIVIFVQYENEVH